MRKAQKVTKESRVKVGGASHLRARKTVFFLVLCLPRGNKAMLKARGREAETRCANSKKTSENI